MQAVIRRLAQAALAAALPLTLVVVEGSCGSSPEAPPALRSTEGRLYDASGRELLLRGVNARVNGIFDVSFDDGRLTLEHIPDFTEDDCRFLAEDLGFDHLRLPVNWSAIEPHPDDFREDYVRRILDLAAACERHGVYTLVDLHQDAFSKEIGEDGAPLWAIDPPPTQLLQGPLDDLGARRSSQQVIDAFDTFFANPNGNWAEYIEMTRWLASRIDGQPGVIGLELFNEPYIFFADATLIDFHTQVTQAVREVAPNLTVFFEPAAIRNITDSDAASPAFGMPNAVYAPHIYTDVFEGGYDPTQDLTKLQNSVAGARSEATTHGAALYVGEFGEDDSARGGEFMQAAMDAFDVNLASWAMWLYEEASQGSWGLYDALPTDPPSRGALRTTRADLVARAYPVAVAGSLGSIAYDASTRTLTVGLSGARADVDQIIAVPGRTYPSGIVAQCDGQSVSASVAAGRARFRCAGSTITVSPAP